MYVQDLYKCGCLTMYLHLSQMKTTDHNNETVSVTNTLDTKYITTSLSQFKNG